MLGTVEQPPKKEEKGIKKEQREGEKKEKKGLKGQRRERKVYIVAFVHFCGVNVPTKGSFCLHKLFVLSSESGAQLAMVNRCQLVQYITIIIF
jgi:hypothetical protein